MKAHIKFKETDIQASICEYLSYKGVFFWRSNNVPIFTEGRYRSMPKYSLKGVPDIICIVNGTFVGLEVKNATGVVSDDQAAFRKAVEAAGGKYFVVRSIDDVINALQSLKTM